MDLHAALEAAIAAARDAGALLRDEWHRPGGPRHTDPTHATVDEEAERLIRSRLAASFPDWRFVGEETGEAGRANAPATWFVDPNDSTKAYIAGWRGSAVSIGLVSDGVPVLGVVHAPLAPDDAGDLVAWAEGQPLTRNGVVVERTPLPRAPDPGVIVVVSQDALAKPRLNARLLDPMRHRTMPSIAYRLALVAAGEADAAVGLAGPQDYDLAGGHALLRAVGGEVCDGDGHPVRYAPRLGPQARVFGGAPALALDLARREWQAVFGEPDGDDRMAGRIFAGARPAGPGCRVADGGLLARGQGLLLGLVAGDDLGQLVEFLTASQVQAAHPAGPAILRDGGGAWNTLAGQPTDDGELALSLCRTLARDGDWTAGAVTRAYAAWYRSGPFDVGATILSALGKGTPNPESQANGALMRVAPLALLAPRLDDDALAERAREDARLTHPHPVCVDASAVYVVAVAHALRAGQGSRAAARHAAAWARESGLHPDVLGTLEAAEAGPPPSVDGGKAGWVRYALQIAWHHGLRETPVAEALPAVARLGGDADTNCAITGALLGAAEGRDALPLQWRRAVLTARPVQGPTARPMEWWPVDVMQLAEAVLAAPGRGAAP